MIASGLMANTSGSPSSQIRLFCILGFNKTCMFFFNLTYLFIFSLGLLSYSNPKLPIRHQTQRCKICEFDGFKRAPIPSHQVKLKIPSFNILGFWLIVWKFMWRFIYNLYRFQGYVFWILLFYEEIKWNVPYHQEQITRGFRMNSVQTLIG